jgi:hypothetical protein
VLYPLIGVRLHGWLDDLVVLVYLVGMYVLGMSGAALAIGSAGALAHFGLARCTRYPQGTWALISFRTHAFIELGEGLVVIVLALALVPSNEARAFLAVMGALQLGAFAFSDYRWPVTT